MSVRAIPPAAAGRRALAAFVLCLGFAAGAHAQEGQGDVVYVPTPQEVVDEMLRVAKVGPEDFLIDLGSGDGRIVVTAAQRHGARGFGVDLDRYLLDLARANAKKAGVADRAWFVEQDLFETDLSPATVVTSYLLPEMNRKLQPKFLALRPGTRIVLHDYDFETNWSPDLQRVLDVPGKDVGEPGKSYVMLYIVPARVAGRWESTVNGVPWQFAFEQEYQYVEGEARAGSVSAKIPEFRLAGDRIEFSVPVPVRGRSVVHRFTGRVLGDRIEGSVTAGAGRAQPWSARLIEPRPISDGTGRPPRRLRHLKQG